MISDLCWELGGREEGEEGDFIKWVQCTGKS